MAAYRYIVVNPTTGYRHTVGIGETDWLAVPLPRVEGAEAESWASINRVCLSRENFEAHLDALNASWTRLI